MVSLGHNELRSVYYCKHLSRVFTNMLCTLTHWTLVMSCGIIEVSNSPATNHHQSWGCILIFLMNKEINDRTHSQCSGSHIDGDHGLWVVGTPEEVNNFEFLGQLILVQVMVCWLREPIYYLNQCWSIYHQWDSVVFTWKQFLWKILKLSILTMCLKITHSKFHLHHPEISVFYIDGLVQDCSISIPDALEILPSCTELMISSLLAWGLSQIVWKYMYGGLWNSLTSCIKISHRFLMCECLCGMWNYLLLHSKTWFSSACQ